MSHTCNLCGRIVFKTFHEYEEHRRIFHGIHSTIRPERITNRMPAQIVKDAECTWLKDYLIAIEGALEVTTVSNEHLDACQCDLCFQKKLDALVESSNASVRDLCKE